MSKDAKIRTLKADDLVAWSRMRRALWPDTTLEVHKADCRDALAKRNVANFVAEVGGAPIAFMEVATRPYVDGCDGSPVAFVEGIWVDETHRKQGIGRLLIGAAESWAKAQGLSELGSNALLANTESHKAHLGWAFEETERVVYFRKKL